MMRNTLPPLASNDLFGVGDYTRVLVRVILKFRQRFVDDGNQVALIFVK